MKMNRTIRLLGLIFAVTVSASLNYHVSASETTSKSTLEKHVEQLLDEEVKLSPVGAFGDVAYHVVEIDKEHMCGISCGRLKIFKKSNIEDVTASYWSPSRTHRMFKYYKGYVYLAQSVRTIDILDVRDPDQIRLVKKLNIILESSAMIDISDDKLFAYDTYEEELVIWSLSDPESPREITRFALVEDTEEDIDVCGVVVSGDRIYMAAKRSLIVLALKEDDRPELSGEITIEGRYVTGLIVAEPLVYVFCAGKIQVFDVSDPSEITLKSSSLTSLPKLSGKKAGFGVIAESVLAHDNMLFVYGEGQLRILDLRVPWSPEQIGYCKVHSYHRCNLLIHKNHLFTSGEVFDVSDPRRPAKVSRWTGGCLSMDAMGDFLFAIIYNSLEIWDISSPAKVSMIRKIDVNQELADVAVYKGTIYLGFKKGRVRACRLKSNYELETIGEINLKQSGSSILRDLAVEDDLLYVVLGSDGIIAVDIIDPENLEVYSRFSMNRPAERIKVVDGYVFVAFDRHGTAVVDMVEKGFEKKVAHYPSTDRTKAIDIAGSFVYTAENTNGVMVYVSSVSDNAQ